MESTITELTVRKVGNSAGIIMPQTLLKALGLDVGKRLKAEVEDGRVTLTPVAGKRRYTLVELLKQCDPKAPMPKDLLDWDGSCTINPDIYLALNREQSLGSKS